MTGYRNRTSAEDHSWIGKLEQVLQAFRAVDPDITVNSALALLMIARKPGISQSTLADKHHMDIHTGTVTRICAVLSERGNRGTPGKSLIEITHPPGDYRSTAQYLTDKGAMLLSSVRRIMLS